ncbi:MAG: glutamate racemase [Chitinivibrionales bacterium]|nr:glutamate racemase [Chitinivibrionales bacterium]
MSDERAVGVLDCGIGGLTIVKELNRLMPQEKMIYLADTGRSPYASRSAQAIREFGVQGALFLTSFDIKMLIVACDTLSAVALDQIREVEREIPVIGVILPVCKAAITRTAAKKIGVIGTTALIQSEQYNRTIGQLDAKIKVFSKACPLLIPLIEEGLFNHEIAHIVAQYYLYEMIDTGIDCLILGSTYYPMLMEVIQDTVSNRIELVDSALWTAYEAQNILDALENQSISDKNGLPQSQFFVTDQLFDLSKSIERFLGVEIKEIQKIEIEQLTTTCVRK